MSGRRRSRTTSVKQLRREARAAAGDVVDLELVRIRSELDAARPRTRGDCAGIPRPCPYARCKYHLALEVTEAGSIKENFPGVELHELAETCALDVAERGGITLEEVGALLNVTRERVRQTETPVLRKLRSHLEEEPPCGSNRRSSPPVTLRSTGGGVAR